MDYIALGIGIILGVGFGFLIAKLLKNDAEQLGLLSGKLETVTEENLQKEKELRGIRESKNQLLQELEHWKSNFSNLKNTTETQKKELEDLQSRFKAEFKVLANEILEEKSERFTKQNKSNLDDLLTPLKEKINAFEKKVQDTYEKGFEERVTLKSEIKHLLDLNKQLSDDANNLANALKGESKTQGDWGELRLELILEKAGLQKGIHFSSQETFRDEEGNMQRPDFIIHLPDDKQLVIDSKVSLTAYESYFSSEEELKPGFLKAHITSIKNHIKELGAKNYQNLYDINTPDYVLMYLPIEPAFNLALQNDEKLFTDALEKNIVLVTTSTLLATMKTVSFIWTQDKQKKNVIEIAKQGGALYDKFKSFVDDLLKVGKGMNDAKKTYDEAMKKLSTGQGNLVRRVERLKELGAKATKILPESLIERSNSEDV